MPKVWTLDSEEVFPGNSPGIPVHRLEDVRALPLAPAQHDNKNTGWAFYPGRTVVRVAGVLAASATLTYGVAHGLPNALGIPEAPTPSVTYTPTPRPTIVVTP